MRRWFDLNGGGSIHGSGGLIRVVVVQFTRWRPWPLVVRIKQQRLWCRWRVVVVVQSRFESLCVRLSVFVRIDGGESLVGRMVVDVGWCVCVCVCTCSNSVCSVN